MRTKLMVLALVLSAAAANADNQMAGTPHISVFLQDLQHSSSTPHGSEWGTATGISFGYSWSKRMSTTLSVTAQRYPQIYVKFLSFQEPVLGNASAPVTFPGTLTTFPIDLVHEVSFSNSTRWTPYTGAGLRYVRAPFNKNQSGQVQVSPGYTNRLEGEAVGGVRLRLRRNMDLQFGLARLVRSTSIPNHDPLTRGALGLRWQF
jgi:opacity protein-like surface antigen